MHIQKVIAAGDFKQKCLALMDEVAMTGEEVIITKHGSPVCKLIPLSKADRQSRFGWLKGSVKIQGDLTDSQEDLWEVDQ